MPTAEEIEQQYQAQDYLGAMSDYESEKDKAHQDWLDKFIQGGWYAPRQGVVNTGRPSTYEEKAWLEKFYAATGTKPTERQVTAGMGGKLGTNYLPDSLMADIGFRNEQEYFNAQNRGLTYGPWMGKNVPFGGTVTLDAQGRPMARYYGQTPLVGERVLAPYGGTGTATDFNLNDLGYANLQKEAYGSPNVYNPPTRQQALAGIDPYRLYQTMFADFTGRKQEEYNKASAQYQGYTDQVNTITKQINGLSLRVAGGFMTADDAHKQSIELQKQIADIKGQQSELQKQMSGMLSPEELIKAQNQANMILRNLNNPTALLGLEELPFYGQMYFDNLHDFLSGEINTGRITKEKANLLQDEAQKAYKSGKKMPELPLFEESIGKYARKYLGDVANQANQSALDQYAGKFNYQQREPRPEKTIPSNYRKPGGPYQIQSQLNYSVYSDDFPPAERGWLNANYSNLYNLWSQTAPEQSDFMDWVKQYLAGVQFPESAPNNFNSRLTPPTRSMNY